MKSAKKKPLESDEHGPLKHAPRPKYDSLSWSELYYMRQEHWSGMLHFGYQCRQCSHSYAGHMRGWCEECHGICTGCDQLHDVCKPITNDLRAAFDKYAKRRK